MYGENGLLRAVILCIGLVPPFSFGQQGPAYPKKVLAPQQETYQQWETKYRSLQAQGKQVFDAEMAREKAGDCPDAQTTSDFNTCFGRQLTITGQNLKSYEGIIRELMVPSPQPSVEKSGSVNGLAGPSLTPARQAAEFGRVEQSWRQYSKAACAAAYHQFDGGSGAQSFEMQCELQLTRDHMRELHMIYGESFL